jgi:hypothetical protein
LGTYEEEFVMGGVCCAQEEEEEEETDDNTTTTTTTMVEDDGKEVLGRPRHDAAVERSLRVSVVAKLVERKRRLGSPSSLANATGVLLPAEEARRLAFDPAVRYGKEQQSSASPAAAAVRCLCRRSSSSAACSDLTCLNRPSPDAGYLYPGLYRFAPIMASLQELSAVLAPGAASMPHRFFSPGLYLWHDYNNPAVHGVVLVAPSELEVDECGVCGGDGSSCATRRSVRYAIFI